MLNKKIKRLLIGTNNEGKLKEIKDLLPKNIKIYSTNKFKLNLAVEYVLIFFGSKSRISLNFPLLLVPIIKVFIFLFNI